jgi:hypothetical protein
MSLSTSSDAAAQVPSEQLAALKKAAADYVARATGMTLDGSEESLAIVDHYIAKVRMGSEASRKPDVLRLVAAALGAYLGELMTSRFGGGWRIVDRDPEEPSELGALAAWRIGLEAAPLLVDPIGMAAEALLVSDDEDEIDAESDEGVPGFTLLPEAATLQEALHASLSRLAPVSADYYYSLTGRFETLTYVVDLLSDLRHQQAAKLAAPDADDDTDADDDATDDATGVVSDDDRRTAAAPKPPARL